MPDRYDLSTNWKFIQRKIEGKIGRCKICGNLLVPELTGKVRWGNGYACVECRKSRKIQISSGGIY
jgi:RNase P subunit RPR2